MSELIIPGLIAVAAVTLTYVLCIRPMRNGRHCGMPGNCHPENSSDARDVEVQRLRAEVASLHRDISLQHAIEDSTTGVGPTIRQSNRLGNRPR